MNINDVIAQRLTASHVDDPFGEERKIIFRGRDSSWVTRIGNMSYVTWTLMDAKYVPQEGWEVEEPWSALSLYL
jgi:hypothetical protein